MHEAPQVAASGRSSARNNRKRGAISIGLRLAETEIETKKRRPAAALCMSSQKAERYARAALFRDLRQAAKPRPAKPASIIAQVDASGTDEMLSVWEPLLSP